MRILLDTNIILDLLLERDPFVQDAEKLISKIENGNATGLICATTVTTIHYLIRKKYDKEKSSEIIGSILKLFEIANVTRAVLEDALTADDIDYEDSVIYKSAFYSGADIIVTRDRKGFLKSDLPVMTPKELLALLQ